MNNSDENRKSHPSDILPILIFGFIITYITYSIVISLLPLTLSDYHGHIYVYLAEFLGESKVKGLMMSPYFLWHTVILFLNRLLHIPIDISAAMGTCFFVVLSYMLTCYMISKWSLHIRIAFSPVLIAFFSFVINIQQPVWISYLDAGVSRGVGAFSVNPFYNPTFMAAKPFALLCFMQIYDLWSLEPDSPNAGPVFFNISPKGLRIFLSGSLLLSVLAKPVFAEMFIPAVGLVMLAKQITLLIKERTKAAEYFRSSFFPAFCAAVPSILCLLFQFGLFFLFGGSYADTEGPVITKFLEVWSAFTENIPLSILLSMSFPIFILLIDAKGFLSTSMGKLSVTGYIVGFILAAFLGEGGDKLLHGNFLWPMMSGMMILWISSFLHFLTLQVKPSSKLSRICIAVGYSLLLIHLHYGFLYIFDTLGWNFFIF